MTAETSRAVYGLLIDYSLCTGCLTCEMACSVEHQLPLDRKGIKVTKVGPWQIEGDRWQYDFVPIPTDECDLCSTRLAAGKAPTCVKHCQAQVIQCEPIEKLTLTVAKKPKQVLFSR